MKTTISILGTTLFLVLILSCQSEREKTFQSEFDKIQGTWTIDNFTLPPNAPDSLQNFFKSGILLFEKCKYYSKISVCGGEAAVNEAIIALDYIYLYDVQQFRLSVIHKEATPKTFPIAKAIQLFDGNWEVMIDDNKMVAKRKDVIKSYLPPGSFYKGEVMFTATRK